MNKDIIYEFRNIVEESRTEDRQDYYIKLRNTLDLLEELEAEVESQDKTIDKLVEEQEEREKYTHSLEEQNAMYRGQLNDAFDRGFIHISVIQNKTNYILDILKKHKSDLDYEPWSEYKISGSILFDLVYFLEDLLEERNK